MGADKHKLAWEGDQHHNPEGLEFLTTSAQQRWEDARMRERAGAHVPVDEYEVSDGAAPAKYQPTAQDTAVQPEDYSLSEAQLEFELSKAMKEQDGTRVAALKIVKALRTGSTRLVKKKPHGKGNLAAVSAWLDD